jgi:dihydrofolate reductase
MNVVLLMALTVDGMIARDANHFPDWTSKQDKAMFKQVTQKAGVIVMGSKTYDAIGRPLPGRKNVVMTRNKQRRSSSPELVYTDKEPAALLIDLAAEGYDEVILAGGATINTLFARQGLIDEIQVTYSPKVFGAGLTLFAGELSMDLQLLTHRQLGTDEVLIRYRVRK